MLRVQSPLPAETEDLIHRVIGCGIAVHRALGSGYSERHYSSALTIELDVQKISYEREKTIRITYRGHELGTYRVDLVVGGALVVEIKAVDQLAPVHQSQVLGYLHAAKLRAGLLMNFRVGAMPDGLKRLVL
jgi:GxxExxY protein